MIIKLCNLKSARRVADRSVSIQLVTATEQSSEDMQEIDSLFQHDVIIAIKPCDTPFLDAEIAGLDKVDTDIEDKSKTPSKRMRNSLWRWQESTLNREPTAVEFKEFYQSKMEVIIEHIKSKIES